MRLHGLDAPESNADLCRRRLTVRRPALFYAPEREADLLRHYKLTVLLDPALPTPRPQCLPSVSWNVIGLILKDIARPHLARKPQAGTC